ncbi:hypothetical protein [Micromonospora echinofusca]|uniref:TNFR-Cys domain-containing protein n=1 Tax=Micromonospora echinofusca TaxID=47858 RepID=A0ABS3VZ47_MICEH|nr:hypothetical protein [Micromonospora echinofusca]MBO4209792.1 hypothetical protein [Micromonospora echinofusca]
MREHPCQRHRPGHHTDACLTGRCGFCGTDLRTAASGECRACLRIVCEACDGGYQPDLGPICRPCAPPRNSTAGTGPGSTGPSEDQELHRLCVLDLALSCGHLATVALTGWYPQVVACCDRLGGTVLRGHYVPYASHVDYVDLHCERHEYRPNGTPRTPDRLIGRRPRTDDPHQPPYPGSQASAGRYPARVGAAWSLDGSACAADLR